MNKIKGILITLLILSVSSLNLFCEGTLDNGIKQSELLELNPVIQGYIDLALQNNLGISIQKQKVERTNAERKEAFASFLPNISFQSRYTAAGGGRMITIDMNEYIGGMIPGLDIPVVEFPFLRAHEQETKFNVTQTLFAGGAVLNGYKARSSMQETAEWELKTLEWQKRYEVIESYLNYLKTIELVAIKENVLKLSKEGLDLSKSLFKQDKLLKNDVMRAEVNVSKAESDLAEAIEQKMLAARYFNNLLNRNPYELIEAVSISLEYAQKIDNFGTTEGTDTENKITDFESRAFERRFELKGLDSGLDAAGDLKAIAFSEYLPKLILSVDYGWQGEEYSFTKDDDYYMASLVLRLNIFDGGAREAKMEQAATRVKELELQKLDAQRKIGLQVEQAYRNLYTTRKQVRTAFDQMASAEENYRIVKKRFSLGMALPLDMNDALVQYDIASSQKVIALYNYLQSLYYMENALGNSGSINND
ncbi:MAG: TolC family protein [Acidobacteria bacterium]|nr:TolC family protein [Acidobacteriota bacterium]